MSEAFDKVMDGLKDARAYLNGKRDGFVVPEVKVPELDMATIWATCRCKRPRCMDDEQLGHNALAHKTIDIFTGKYFIIT